MLKLKQGPQHNATHETKHGGKPLQLVTALLQQAVRDTYQRKVSLEL